MKISFAFSHTYVLTYVNIFTALFSPNGSRGGIQTLILRIASKLFYHLAKNPVKYICVVFTVIGRKDI
jgi:hypothetical protein